MQLKNIIDGLLILLPYYDDPNGFHINAEHDQLYAYATDRPLSNVDVDKIRALEWFQPDQEHNEDGGIPKYDPESGWSAFT